MSKGFPRTYSGPRVVITPPNLGQTPAHNPNIHLDPVLGVLYIVIASPRPIWAHISRARSILYIKGFPTHYWTRLLGASFNILSQNPVCLMPLTAEAATIIPQSRVPINRNGPRGWLILSTANNPLDTNGSSVDTKTFCGRLILHGRGPGSAKKLRPGG